MRNWMLFGGAAVLLALSGCATGPEYSRDETDSEQVEADLENCRAQARQLQAREEAITRDIRASRADSLRPGATDFIDEIEDLRPQRQFSEIVDDCMRRLGYESNWPGATGLWNYLTGG